MEVNLVGEPSNRDRVPRLGRVLNGKFFRMVQFIGTTVIADISR